MPPPASGCGTRSQLAVQTLNETGGVLGRQVKLVAVDDDCGTDQAAAAALELIKAGVACVIGHSLLALVPDRGADLRGGRASR